MNHHGEDTGFKDRKEQTIMVGDLVEFYACAEHGTMAEQNGDCGKRMVDIIVREDLPVPGTGGFAVPRFFAFGEMGGAFLWRVNKVCRVVGKMPDDVHLFVAAAALPKLLHLPQEVAIKEVVSRYEQGTLLR